MAAMEDVLELYEEEYDPQYPTVSGDAKRPDLVVTVDGLQVVFHNTGTGYAPMR